MRLTNGYARRNEYGHCDWKVQDKAEQIALHKYDPRGRYTAVFQLQS